MPDPSSPTFVGLPPPTGHSPPSSPPIPPPAAPSGRPPKHPGPPPPRTPEQEAALKTKGIAGAPARRHPTGTGRKTRKRKSKSRRRRNGRTYRRS